MNDIIKNIEAAQLKESVPSFNVGDTVRVSAKIREGNRESRSNKSVISSLSTSTNSGVSNCWLGIRSTRLQNVS